MARKHLQELLKEEQEPFVLKHYINERRYHLKKSATQITHHHLHLRKRKPISQTPTFSCNFRKNPCFFPSCDSDPTKSPLFDFPKSPRRNSNTLLVNVPSITAALLLESALRIQKQSSSLKKPKSRGFGFFGSILKRIVQRKTQKQEICHDGLQWDSIEDLQRFAEERAPKDAKLEVGPEGKEIPELGFWCSCERSDGLEDLDEKSVDFESSSCRTEDFEETVFGGEREGDSRPCAKGYCLSPFRFQDLECVPDSGFRTPEFGSPATSPGRQLNEMFPHTSGEQHDGHIGILGTNKEYQGEEEEEEEEEKEQFSPVSVLDPPFEDDVDTQEPEEKQADEEDEGCFEHNFAAIQRAKQQLLNNIRRFERLAELDPLELEKILAEEEEEEEEEYHNENSVEGLQVLLDNERIVRETLLRPNTCHCLWRIPSDVMIESWNYYTKSNSIDLMLEMDFRRVNDEWMRNREEVQEIAEDVELAIFGFLIREFSDDLIQSSSL